MATKKVIIDLPGVVACGQYEAGIVHEVEAEEADRLIKVKGFRLATKADEKPEEAKATAADTKPPAATAPTEPNKED